MFQSAPFSSVVADAAVDAVPEDGTTADWEEFLRSTSFVSTAPFTYYLHPVLMGRYRAPLIGQVCTELAMTLLDIETHRSELRLFSLVALVA